MRRKNPFAPGAMRQFLAQRSAFETLCERLKTQDGLIRCSDLRVRFDESGYDLVFLADESIAAFPVPESDFVLSYLVQHPDLWNQAAVRVTHAPCIWGAAPMFGVPFRQAVNIALERKHAKSKYFLPERVNNGRYESLLLQLDRVDDVRGRMLQLQAWQYRPSSSYTHFIHALSPNFDTYVHHIDGATVRYSETDLEVLLVESRKVKGIEYRKHFRLDGDIRIEQMHQLASAFLPGTELYDEAFEVAVIQVDA